MKNKSAAAAKKKKLSLKANILPGVLITLCLGFMVFIYAPQELYIPNKLDFWFSGAELLVPSLIIFSAVSLLGIAAFAAAALISEKLYNILLAAVLAATLATYVQGTFFVKGIPSLDGTEYNWNQPSPERIKTIVTWLVAIAAVVFIYIRFRAKALKSAATFVSAALFFMLSASLVSLSLTHSGDTDPSRDYLKNTDYNICSMSSDENIVVLVLDAVDNTAFCEALDANPEFDSTFDDFTQYNNLLSGYVFTAESIPFILSGDWYENDENFIDYQNSALNSSPFISKLEENEYNIGLYTDAALRLEPEIFRSRFENMIDCKYRFTDPVITAKLVISMAGTRYAPWDLKRFVVPSIEYYTRTACDVDYDANVYSYQNDLFYNRITAAEPFTTVDEKCCRIIHIAGAHVPFSYGKGMQQLAPGEATYATSVEACLTICDTYINALKENGLYDNTAVVIISDHGFGKGLVDRTNPILLVKGIDEHHDDMQVSDAPISQQDFAQSFAKLVDGAPGSDIFDYKDGDERERRVIIYAYLKENEMDEYVTTGRADDFAAMQPTGVRYLYE